MSAAGADAAREPLLETPFSGGSLEDIRHAMALFAMAGTGTAVTSNATATAEPASMMTARAARAMRASGRRRRQRGTVVERAQRWNLTKLHAAAAAGAML